MYVVQKETIEEILKNEGESDISTHVVACEIIERMVNVGMELSWLDASNLRLNGASFREADFADAQLREVNLIKADLSKADFMKSGLNKAELSGANLRKADFTQADLRNAVFDYADLTDAKLTDANIRGAKLKYAEGLTQPQLDSACITGDAGEIPPEVPNDLRRPERACWWIIHP